MLHGMVHGLPLVVESFVGEEARGKMLPDRRHLFVVDLRGSSSGDCDMGTVYVLYMNTSDLSNHSLSRSSIS